MAERATSETWDAIILGGGAGERLGGVVKSDLVLGERSLLDLARAAVTGAEETVIVGGPRQDGALWAVEDPPGGGPAAGVLAGLRALAVGRDPASWTVVLAVDTPGAAQAVPALLAARAEDGAWLVEADGRHQPLLAVYRTAAFAHNGEVHGAPMRTLVNGFRMVAVVDSWRSARDVDTWDDVEYWKGRLS